MIKRALISVLLASAIAACGNAPPAPVDRFYRLQATPLAAATTLPVRIEVRQISADSLYAERAIVFSERSDPRQLRQYHYHLWLYPPAQLVRDHLRASLDGGRTASTGGPAPLAFDARIVAFERVVDGAAGSAGAARAALEVSLSAGGTPLLNKRYEAEYAAGDGSMSAFSAAMEQALGKIYAEVARDAGALERPGAVRPTSGKTGL